MRIGRPEKFAFSAIFVIPILSYFVMVACTSTQEKLKSAHQTLDDAKEVVDKAWEAKTKACEEANNALAISQLMATALCQGENVPEVCSQRSELALAAENVKIACEL